MSKMVSANFELSNELCVHNKDGNSIYIEKEGNKFFLNIRVQIKAKDPISLAARTPHDEQNTRESIEDGNLYIEDACRVEIRKKDLKNSDGTSFLRVTATVPTKVPGTSAGLTQRK